MIPLFPWHNHPLSAATGALAEKALQHMNVPIGCEILPWQEINRMLDAGEAFSPALARVLWEATWREPSAQRSPFPHVNYETGLNVMPDGVVVLPDFANGYTHALMTALRNTLHSVVDIVQPPETENERDWVKVCAV